MKRNILTVAVIVSTILLFESCKSAQQKNKQEGKHRKRPTAEQLIEKMDTNEDGLISVKEARGPLAENFTKIDENEDGFLSLEELENMPEPSHNNQRGNHSGNQRGSMNGGMGGGMGGR